MLWFLALFIKCSPGNDNNACLTLSSIWFIQHFLNRFADIVSSLPMLLQLSVSFILISYWNIIKYPKYKILCLCKPLCQLASNSISWVYSHRLRIQADLFLSVFLSTGVGCDRRVQEGEHTLETSFHQQAWKDPL